MATQLTHQTYKFVDEKDADAFAWVFTDPKKPMEKVAFKFPPLKPDEIRAKVTHTGLCHSDVLTVQGSWGPVNYPIAPGHEIVGEVSHIGSDVKGFKIGDKIAFGAQRECCDKCEACTSNYEPLCLDKALEQTYTYGPKFWGGYATSIQQPAKFYHKIPENLPAEKVPPLLCAGITVYTPIAEYCKPGQNLAVIGIGGLGHLAVQYGKAWGCKVTAFTSSPGKEDFIKKLGADEVVVATPENLQKEAGKYHVVLNTLPAGKDLTQYIMLAKFKGTLVQVGAPPAGENDSFYTPLLIMSKVNIVGSGGGSRKDVKEMLEFSSKHNIVSLCEHFDFEKFPEAFDRLEHGKPIFRCVVDCTKAGPKH